MQDTWGYINPQAYEYYLFNGLIPSYRLTSCWKNNAYNHKESSSINSQKYIFYKKWWLSFAIMLLQEGFMDDSGTRINFFIY